ncbi:P-loop containing nucleoside triphosphate hydrolase protein [Anaeromyces robustus]|uniref:p-loop containing nucleoside triphosphate hydrolase protein n=1 Tax=Anaeromyces robustus TaxID=1754192 RepID=A0A1Y1X9Y0_9FUNG|nr:P-loop containing nucleoside triphosphate hydrolase protein [Anaeromyces robustus]|eukprot:ORX82548.1 P-loop containing nucleoside triphosphate hydrolase protein [Anaeromyces robustus]
MSGSVFNTNNYKAISFKNEKELNDYYDKNTDLAAAIIFEKDLLTYTLRINGTEVPDPESTPIDNYGKSRAESPESLKYLTKFSYLQSLIDSSIISLKTNSSITINTDVGNMSKPPIYYSQQSALGPKLFSLYMNFLFLVHILVIVTFLVDEKEKKIKEGMLMSGVHPSIFWLSWEIVYLIIITITSILVALFLYVTKSYSYINPVLLFILILLYGLSNCGIGFVVSVFFKKTKTATSFVGCVVSLVCMVYLGISYLNKSTKIICSIFFSPVTMGLAMEEVSSYDDKRINIGFSNLFDSDVGLYMLILLINNILYFGLAVIFEYFFDEYSNFNIKRKSRMSVLTDQSNIFEHDIEKDMRQNEKCLVEISNISKEFERETSENEVKEDDQNKNIMSKIFKSKNSNPKESFLAVNHVSFKVYKDEIFAILGHNGAGKTTLIQIMIGLLKASEGNVYYDGTDFNSNITKIRREFGVCSQANILFDDLTVENHINIFASIKNVSVDIDEILKEVDLEHKRNDKVRALSGGQKRKLCIAIAIIGNPKYIFLDEPTTGLDPLSRRKVWDLLLNKKKGRVIFLTTHYMDEADILADRKLILSHGKIRCLGSSLYLKNHFNMQYSLDVESNSCNEVNNIIHKYIPESQINIPDEEKQLKDSNIEMRTWKLPISSTSQFSKLFDELEAYRGENNLIKNYALSMPTLEELFIRLEDDSEESRDNNINNNDFVINTHESLPKLDSIEKISNLKKIMTIIKFRLKIFFHNKTFAASVFITPIFIAVITFAIIKVMNQYQLVEFKSKEISSSLYDSDVIWNVNNLNIPNFSTNIYSNFINGGNITEYNDQELNNISKTIGQEPYYISSVSGSLVNNEYNFNIHYNDSMTHALPVTMNALSNSILASKNINERITLKSHPFSYGNYTFVTVTSLLIGIYLGAALLVGCSMYGPLIVRERANQLLQQLQLNGVSRINYWISALCTDTPLFIISCILVIIVGIIFEPDQFLDIKIIGIIIITILLWTVCTIFYQYVISFAFNKETTANSFMQLFNILPSYIGVTVFSIINAANVSYDPNKIFSTPAIIFEIIITLINPPYAIMGILNALFTINFYLKVLKIDSGLNLLLRFNSGITPLLITLAIAIVIYFLILLRLDTMINQTNAKDIHVQDEAIREKNENIIKNGDDDVYKEFLNVVNNYDKFPISTLQISKEYKVNVKDAKEKKLINERNEEYQYGEIHKSKYGRNNYVKTAVEDVSFGINKHECFGLLGPNGAGKSTTLNMVTSTIPQTTGKIYYDGTESHIARLNEISLGYCPQNDTFWKELTIREHIEFFLRIRGFPEDKAKDYATQYIKCCNLEEHQNKRASKLSGGTKRKLCLLMAISGYPNQILLDEPTAGMDPSTRRYVWNIIKETKKDNNSAIIMTTHSMEEAENLCDRIGILINGRLICIGSPEHIKMKYGNTYNLEVQSNNINTFHQKIIEEGNLLGTEYKKEEKSFDRTNYEIIIKEGIGRIFDIMEKCKESGLITDYSFSQTTLEQVFINFAKLQITNNDSNDH